MKPLNPWLLRLSVAALVAVGILISILWKEEEAVSLPAKLGEMKLAQQLSGNAAQGMIDHLHGKGVTPHENFIGFYEGNRARATLYVSVYANATEAKEVDGKMAQRIEAGNPVFGSYEKVSIAGHTVSVCVGMGQVHYFFSRGNRLYWLAVDPPVAQRTAESLLNTVGR